MILHGLRAGSSVVTNTGCCPSAARRSHPGPSGPQSESLAYIRLAARAERLATCGSSEPLMTVRDRWRPCATVVARTQRGPSSGSHLSANADIGARGKPLNSHRQARNPSHVRRPLCSSPFPQPIRRAEGLDVSSFAAQDACAAEQPPPAKCSPCRPARQKPRRRIDPVEGMEVAALWGCIACTVNGVRRQAEVEPRLLIDYFLRESLGAHQHRPGR